MEEEKESYDTLTKEELFKLTAMLYESSILMGKVNKPISDQLLIISSVTMEALDRKGLTEEQFAEIQAIEQEILCKDS